MAVRKVAAPAKQKLRKLHGPKRKLFHQWTRSMRLAFGQTHLLNKYNNFESFKLACVARGCKNPVYEQFNEMIKLPTKQAKDEWFRTLRG